MAFITFLYKIKSRRYYGKFVTNYICDDHEGLDLEIKDVVLDGVNTFLKQKGLPPIDDVIIGVLSYSYDNYAPCYSSKEEIEAFDFYCESHDYSKFVIYINGKKLIL